MFMRWRLHRTRRRCTNTAPPLSPRGCAAADLWAFVLQVAELLLGLPIPIVYFEQGHEWLFGDPIRFQVWAASVLTLHVTSAACPP